MTEGLVDAHELTKTYDCRTPGCEGEAKAKTGRQSYCLSCQVQRGTARPDGSVIQGRIPMAPGSRSGRGQGKVQGPFEAKALQLVAAGRALDFAVERYRVVKPTLEQAIEAWCDALAQLPKVADGELGSGAGPPEPA